MIRRTILTAAAFVVVFTSVSLSQNRGTAQSDAELRQSRIAIETELESIAVIDRKVMVPMRDGKRMATDIYRPKDDVEEVPDHLCPHALQLQLLGRAQRRCRAT